LSTIRRAACDGLYDRHDVIPYYHGLTVYLLGALKYANLDQVAGAKQVAFWAAATVQHLLQAEFPCAKYRPTYRPDVPCPYRSLLAFHEEHAGSFFGREGLTRRLLDRLEAVLGAGDGYRLLAIIGLSGSGKSSLARAGLLAALKRGEITGSEEWHIARCRPGADPLDSLALALGHSGALDQEEAGELYRGMQESERALHRATIRYSPDRRLVVLVDQLEEVFALCEAEELRQAFINNLCYAAGVMGGQTIVLLVLRADFYGHCADYDLARVLPTHQVLIEPMSGDELRRAIEQPAFLSGRAFEARLVDRLLEDVRGHPGGLPLLQYTLTELWARCRGEQLTFHAYAEIGGLTGSLERQAEHLYSTLSADERAICKRILLRMVQPGEGTGDTCRRVPYVELSHPDTTTPELEAIVGKLVTARLITSGGDRGGRFVEVAHEALVHGWSRLHAWVDGNRESLRTHRRLAEATREWVESHRDASYLYWGIRLDRLEQWVDTHEADLSVQEHTFMSACRAERDAQRRHRSEADSRRLAESALLCLEDDYELALLLAIEAGRAARTPPANKALRAALLSGHSLKLVGHTGPVRHVAWDGAGARVASAGADGTARIWHADGGAGPVVLRGHTDQVWQVAWEGSGERVVTASDDGTARVWDTTSGNQLAQLSSPDTRARVYHAAWGPDGARIVTAAGDGTARVWDGATGALQMVLGASGEVGQRSNRGGDRSSRRDRIVHAAWSRHGTRVLTSRADGAASMWDVESGIALLTIAAEPGWHDGASCARWSPDETRIITAGGDHAARLWSARDGSLLAVLAGHAGWAFLVAWSPDGTRVLTASVDGTARVWSLGSSAAKDPHTGTQLAVLTGHLVVRHAAWNHAGTRVLTSGDDGTVRVWNADSGAQRAVLSGHAAKVGHAAWNQAGTHIVTASDDGTARVWDLAGREKSVGAVGQMSSEELLRAACVRAERNMSQQEWRQYMRDRPYRDTCPGKSIPVPSQAPGAMALHSVDREEDG
jgi:WD40 repeat protein